MALQSINPANGDLIASYEEMTIDEVKGIIADVDTICFNCLIENFEMFVISVVFLLFIFVSY